jgi:hypothetical protein
MKPRSPLPLGKPLTLAIALLGMAFACLAAQTPTKAPSDSSPAATNTLPILPQIPQSVFIIPLTPQEGIDPFFPRSMRLFNDVVVKTNLQPAAAVVELKLNGISGTADHRLAIINNRTFETGEEGEVVSNVGRSRIICQDIKADSVRVLISGEERVLRLRSR